MQGVALSYRGLSVVCGHSKFQFGHMQYRLTCIHNLRQSVICGHSNFPVWSSAESGFSVLQQSVAYFYSIEIHWILVTDIKLLQKYHFDPNTFHYTKIHEQL